MSKEEILRVILNKQEPVSSDKIGEQMFIATMQAMDTYAQEIAVGFIKYMNENDIKPLNGKWMDFELKIMLQQFLTNKNEKK